MFKNIERKQRVIDDRQRNLKRQHERRKAKQDFFFPTEEASLVENRMFESDFVEEMKHVETFSLISSPSKANSS